MRKTIYSPGQQALVSLLRERRIIAGLHQADLAAKLGTSQSVVSKFETGERQIDVLELRQICHALDMTLEVFIRELEVRLREEGLP